MKSADCQVFKTKTKSQEKLFGSSGEYGFLFSRIIKKGQSIQIYRKRLGTSWKAKEKKSRKVENGSFQSDILYSCIIWRLLSWKRKWPEAVRLRGACNLTGPFPGSINFPYTFFRALRFSCELHGLWSIVSLLDILSNAVERTTKWKIEISRNFRWEIFSNIKIKMSQIQNSCSELLNVEV